MDNGNFSKLICKIKLHWEIWGKWYNSFGFFRLWFLKFAINSSPLVTDIDEALNWHVRVRDCFWIISVLKWMGNQFLSPLNNYVGRGAQCHTPALSYFLFSGQSFPNFKCQCILDKHKYFK